MILKAFKFRLEPNKEQQILLTKNLGCCRFLYNQMLNERQEKHKNSDKSSTKTEKQYKEEFSFLKEAESSSLQQSRVDLTQAYKNFFRKIKAGIKVSLRFKSRRNPKQSFRIINNNNNIKVLNNAIQIPKIGEVKFKRELLGQQG